MRIILNSGRSGGVVFDYSKLRRKERRCSDAKIHSHSDPLLTYVKFTAIQIALQLVPPERKAYPLFWFYYNILLVSRTSLEASFTSHTT